MIRLAFVTAAAVLALGALALVILDLMARRADGVSRQWINYLADRSRKRDNRKRRYSQWIGLGS